MSNSARFLAVVMASSCAGLLIASPAAAERKGAPITFAGQGGAPQLSSALRASTAATSDNGPVTMTGPATPSERRRIEFRYPGQFENDAVNESEPYAQPAHDTSMTVANEELAGGVVVQAALPSGATLKDQVGVASWYGASFDGLPTANGEIFDKEAMTAAHPTLPLPSLVQVVNEENGREIVVRVNDRGPFHPGRIIDLSKRAADVLGFVDTGEANVRIRYLGPAPIVPGTGSVFPISANGSSVGAESLAPIPSRPTLYDAELSGGNAPLLDVPDPGQTTLPRQASYQTASYSPSSSGFKPQMPPHTSTASSGYFVQTGSFADISNAQKLDASLRNNVPVKIEPARVNNADYFRVLVGPFTSEAAADNARSQLRSLGVRDGFVVSR